MDTLTPWLPALTTTGLLTFALWLGRNLIMTRLTKSVEHEFNKKIEDIKTEQRASEERLKADLRLKESEIFALRSGALNALASRQIALDKRRLEAIDQLWSTVISLRSATWIITIMKAINFEDWASLAARDSKERKRFEAMSGNFDINDLDINGAFKAEPFVTPMVWAVFSALRAVVFHGTARWYSIKSGSGEDFTDSKDVANLIKAVLPDYSDYIDQHGPSAYYYTINPLENRLLSEIQNMLSGVEGDKATLDRASEILKQSNAVMEQASAKNAAMP